MKKIIKLFLAISLVCAIALCAVSCGNGNGDGGGTETGGTESGGTESGGSESGGTESGGTESGGTESGGTESGGTESGGSESGGSESGGTESGGTESGGTESGGTESGGSTPLEYSEGLEYKLSEDGNSYIVVGIGTCTNTDLVIPPTYNDKPVTGIDDDAFFLDYDFMVITSVIIPDSVTTIGAYAFAGCAFGSISLPNSLTSIGEGAFSLCEYIDNLTIPDGVTTIGRYAFSECIRLTSVTIPNSVTYIGDGAFYCCNKLVEVYNLSSLNITAGSSSYGYVGYYALNVYTPTSGARKVWTNSDGYIFYEDGDTCYLIGYTGTETDLTLPDSCNGKNYEIYNFAFYECYECDSLTSVKIPSSVTSIGNYAFAWCRSLTSIEIPSGVTSIGEGAFHGCSSLESVTFGENSQLTSIGGYAFYNCKSLTSIEIPSGVTSIGEEAFSDCSSLTSIEIPSSVTSIGGYAFYNCKSLTSIEIPSSVTSIGDYAFENCNKLVEVYNLSSLNITAGSEDYGCVGYYALKIYTSLEEKSKVWTNSDGYMFYEDGDTCYLIGYTGTETDLTLPDRCNEKNYAINKYAFYGCFELTNVTIPSGITGIGEGAFYNCTSLTSITLPFVGATKDGTSNTHFGYIFGAFSYSSNSASVPSSLKSVTITGGTSIGSHAFHGCSSLESVTFGENSQLTSIGKYAFEGCSSLTSIEIPSSVTSIGSYAFDDCDSLTSITLPFVGATKDGTSNTHFGYIFGAFSYSSNSASVPSSLKSVTITGGTSIGSSAFEGCSSLTSIEIPSSVTRIGDYAFEGCSSLEAVYITNIASWCNISFGDYYANPLCYANNLYLNDELVTELVIPDSVTSIGSSAFRNCSSLTSVKIPSSVTSIGYYAFYNCTSLTSIEIPSSVTRIGYYAFYNCYKLVEVYNLSSLDITAGSSSYGYVGYYALNVYTPTSGKSKLWTNSDGYIFCEDGDTCYLVGYMGNDTDITLPDSCNGKNYEIYNYAFYECDSLTSVKIPSSVTSINYAFEDCSSLKSVTFGENSQLTSIGEDAFSDCSSLTSIEIPSGVTSIGSSAFYNCTSLTSVKIPSSVTSIGSSAFYNCTSLKSVTFGENSQLTSIGSSAFYNCTSLKSVTFGENSQLTSIGSSAFRNCSSLTSVKIPSSVTSIGSSAFYNCTSLEAVYITDIASWCNISFGDNPLYYANNLYLNDELVTELVIPDSVTSIGYKTFEGCSSLTSIEIPSSVTRIGDGAFYNCYKLVEVYNLSSLDITAGSSSYGYVGYYALNVYTPTSGKSKLWTNSDGYIFCEDGDTCYLVGYMGNDTDITLPDSCNGKNYEIYNYAFYECDSLTSVKIPSSVTSIGSSAFENCTSLEYNEYDNAYYLGNSSNPYVILIKAKSTDITSCEIHKDTKFIYNYVFFDCTRLKSVKIPSSVTSIGSYAFEDCSSLEAVYITDIASWCNISFGDYYANPLCYANNLYLNDELVTELVIPDSVTSIGSSAFYNCKSLTSIEIPSSVTSIGSSAFEDCSSLESVTFGENSQLTSIGNYAFAWCTSLTSIEIPSGVTSIGSYAFSCCSSLESVTFGDNSQLTSIGSYAFYGCDSLKSIEIPSSVTSIGNYAFEDCSSLEAVYITDIASWCNISFGNSYANPLRYANNLYLNDELVTELVIPDSVTSIGEGAFYNCTSLESVTFGENSQLTSIGSSAFYNCTSLESVTFGENSQLTSIDSSAFEGCTSLEYNEYDNAYYLGNSSNPYVILIKAKSTDITSCEIHKDTKFIYNYVFFDCTRLKSVKIPSSVTSIGNYAFYNCTSLTSVTFAETSGWWYSASSSATSGPSISSTALANTSTAAEYLTSTYYCRYYWKRSE